MGTTIENRSSSPITPLSPTNYLALHRTFFKICDGVVDQVQQKSQGGVTVLQQAAATKATVKKRERPWETVRDRERPWKTMIDRETPWQPPCNPSVGTSGSFKTSNNHQQLPIFNEPYNAAWIKMFVNVYTWWHVIHLAAKRGQQKTTSLTYRAKKGTTWTWYHWIIFLMLQLLLIVSAPGAKRSIVFQPGTTWRRLTEPLQESAWHHGERLLDQLEKGYWIKQREKTRQQRRPANLPARFAFRQQRKQRNNTKRGRSHTKQKPHKSMGIASRHDRVKPTVSPKYAQTN